MQASANYSNKGDINMLAYYPIGTVVTLSKDDKKNLFMVIGLSVEDDKGNQKDYIAVKYPTGAINTNVFFTFNHDDIGEVVHLGYKNEDFAAYVALINQIVDKEKYN